jgi:hypothetical protein
LLSDCWLAAAGNAANKLKAINDNSFFTEGTSLSGYINLNNCGKDNYRKKLPLQ